MPNGYREIKIVTQAVVSAAVSTVQFAVAGSEYLDGIKLDFTAAGGAAASASLSLLTIERNGKRYVDRATGLNLLDVHRLWYGNEPTIAAGHIQCMIPVVMGPRDTSAVVSMTFATDVLLVSGTFQLDGIYRPFAFPAGVVFRERYHIQQSGVPAANYNFTNSGILVAYLMVQAGAADTDLSKLVHRQIAILDDVRRGNLNASQGARGNSVIQTTSTYVMPYLEIDVDSSTRLDMTGNVATIAVHGLYEYPGEHK